MKKILAIALCVVMLGSFATMFAGCGKTDAGEVNVYNWGEYIAEGQDGLMNVIEEFEKETGIKVNYTTYETNEDLYNMLKNSNVSYDVIVPSEYMISKIDVIVPSEYMISKMIKEGMLLELNYDNIPNYKYINDRFKGLDCDPDNKYTVIYQWGVTALVYDKTKVENTPKNWDALYSRHRPLQLHQGGYRQGKREAPRAEAPAQEVRNGSGIHRDGDLSVRDRSLLRRRYRCYDGRERGSRLLPARLRLKPVL